MCCSGCYSQKLIADLTFLGYVYGGKSTNVRYVVKYVKTIRQLYAQFLHKVFTNLCHLNIFIESSLLTTSNHFLLWKNGTKPI